MKKIALAVVVLSALSSAHAQTKSKTKSKSAPQKQVQLTVSPEQQLGDLNFFQKDESVLITSEMAIVGYEDKQRFNQSGVEYQTNNERDQILWRNAVSYGLQDNLNLGLEATYALKNDYTQTYNRLGTPDKDYKETGLSDFTVFSNYRLRDQPVFVDFSAALTLAMGKAEKGSSDTADSFDGNFRQGHHSLKLAAAAGKKLKKAEWRAGLGLDYHFSGEQKDMMDPNDSKIKTDSRMDFFFHGAGQMRFEEKFILGVEGEWRKFGENKSDVTDNFQKDEYKMDSYSMLTVGIYGKYQFNQSLLFALGYKSSLAYEYDYSSRITNVETNGKSEENYRSQFTLSATYLF